MDNSFDEESLELDLEQYSSAWKKGTKYGMAFLERLETLISKDSSENDDLTLFLNSLERLREYVDDDESRLQKTRFIDIPYYFDIPLSLVGLFGWYVIQVESWDAASDVDDYADDEDWVSESGIDVDDIFDEREEDTIDDIISYDQVTDDVETVCTTGQRDKVHYIPCTNSRRYGESGNRNYDEIIDEEVPIQVKLKPILTNQVFPSSQNSAQASGDVREYQHGQTESQSKKIVAATGTGGVVKRVVNSMPGWIRNDQWRLGDQIGSGSFGEVFQCMNEKGKLFAVKHLNMSGKKNEIKGLLLEIDLMRNLAHKHIVQYQGSKVDEKQGFVYIFLEWVPGGSVAHLLKKFGAFSIGIVKSYTKQILLGLEYLHLNGVIHRDIKGGNVLVSDDGVAKLADFGASTTLSSFGNTQETTTIKGTPYFMAPEVLAQSRYGRKGDIWAVGCTMIEMLSGEPPWKDRDLKGLVQLHMLLSTWVGLPPFTSKDPITPECTRCLDACFERSPDDRPTATVLLGIDFLVDTDDLEESNCSFMSVGGVDCQNLDAAGGDDVMERLSKQMERAVVGASKSTIGVGDDTMGEIEAQIQERAVINQRKNRNFVTENGDNGIAGYGGKHMSPTARADVYMSTNNSFMTHSQRAAVPTTGSTARAQTSPMVGKMRQQLPLTNPFFRSEPPASEPLVVVDPSKLGIIRKRDQALRGSQPGPQPHNGISRRAPTLHTQQGYAVDTVPMSVHKLHHPQPSPSRSLSPTSQFSSSEELDYSQDTFGTPSPESIPVRDPNQIGLEVITGGQHCSTTSTGLDDCDMFNELTRSTDLSSVDEDVSSEMQFQNEEFEYGDRSPPTLFAKNTHLVETDYVGMNARANSEGVLARLQSDCGAAVSNASRWMQKSENAKPKPVIALSLDHGRTSLPTPSVAGTGPTSDTADQLAGQDMWTCLHCHHANAGIRYCANCALTKTAALTAPMVNGSKPIILHNDVESGTYLFK